MNAFTVTKTEGTNAKTYTFSRILCTAEDLKQLDITDEYQAACAVVFALAAYETDAAAAKEMFDYINGPETVSAFDTEFIRTQLRQYPYVMRSYFNQTSPDNGYALGAEVSLTVKENVYSRTEENYVNLLFHSSGADSDRAVKLRKKGSTGEWFVFSDTYRGLMAGIRQPKADDPWA